MSLVVLLGTDGAGKSTVGEAVVAGLRAEGRPAEAYWARWQPFLLRPARFLVTRFWLGNPRFSRGREEPTEVRDLKRSVLGGGGWLGRAYLLLAFLDYWGQHVPAILRRRRRGVLILDRYWYDLVIDACGGAPGAEETAARLVRGGARALFPRPDRLFFLDVSPELAYERKAGENTRDYLERRVAVYRAVARALGAVRIDAGRPLPEVVREVAERMAARE